MMMVSGDDDECVVKGYLRFSGGCRKLFRRNLYSVLPLVRPPQDNNRVDVDNAICVHL